MADFTAKMAKNTKNYLIDSHCHLHDSEFYTPVEQENFLQEAADVGVAKIICIGTDDQSSQAAGEFAVAHPGVYWTYGIHPSEAENYAINLPDFKGENAPVAIGEIGLDYHYEPFSREKQIRLFEEMLQVARDAKKPVSLHIREAFADAFGVLDNFPEITGVVHSFTGSKKELKAALDRGFLIGVNGLATYSTLPLPPLACIILETDAPFLTPEPFRGKINSPKHVVEVAAYLANQLGVTEAEVASVTTQNVIRLFQP